MKTLLHSIGAVLTGLAAGGLVVLGLTWAATVHLFGGDFTAPPTPSYLVANLTYSGWYGPVLTVVMPLGALLGGWLCMARDRTVAARAGESVRPS